MSIVQAVKYCFSNYVTFRGRARRPQFWWFMLFCVLSIGLAEWLVGEDFSGLVTLLLLPPTFAVSARRLHDIGRSGWWQLVSLVPLVGVLVVLYWYVQPSDPHENDYGPV